MFNVYGYCKMKKILMIVFASIAFGTCFPFVDTAQAQMQALFGYSTFYMGDRQQPYVETYLQFDAWTMHFEKTDGGYRATAVVTLVVKQQDSVCYAKHYDLASPVVTDLDKLDFSFLDVQRFSIANGVYDLVITLSDKGVDAPEASVSEKLLLNYDRRTPMLSSLQLMASFRPTEKENILSRGGYDMEPYVSDFVPEQVTQLGFYYEVYNIDREIGKDAFLATAYIEELETGQRAEGEQTVVRKNAAATVPVAGTIDISQLPSGNYNLVCEVSNRAGQLMLYKKVPFIRSNPEVKGRKVSDYALTFAGKYTDEFQLKTYLDALYPIASDMEKTVAADLVRRPGLEEKQAFLYNFWVKRNALAPEAEWLKYKERIDYVQEHFSYPRTRGIMTDRGRVYLQYGPPDYVRDEKNYGVIEHSQANNDQGITNIGNQPEGTQTSLHSQIIYLPYQLWRYNRLPGDDENRVFLFWDEHRSGYYTLLNSNARGEVQEADWERRLCRQMLPEGEIGEVGRQFNRGY